ncbi:AgmX/PglI C-terminal domain-containing protein [bacterium]|nr:AgmX/PglI C-terminal domain-containing protein [bacterium]
MAISIQRKAMKIGLVQDGKLVSESVLQDTDVVTFGSDPSNTITVAGKNVPKSHKLITRAGDEFRLHPLANMSGRVAVDSGAKDVGELAGKDLPLGQAGKGTVNFGKTTVLFQVVVAPPPPPLTGLPKEFRRGMIHKIEPAFVIILICSAILHIATIAYLNSLPAQESLSEDRVAQFQNRIAQIDITEIPPEEPLEDKALEEKKEEPKKAGGEKKAEPKEAPPGDPGPPAEEPVEDVATKGLIGVITALKESGGAVDDIISGGTTDSGLDTALSKIAGGVDVASGGKGLEQRGGGSGGNLTATSAGNLGTVGGPRSVDSGEKKLVKVARVSTGGSSMPSNVDAGSVRGYIMGRIGLVRSCYERALKLDPTLQGKVGVSFNIGADGGVTSCSVASNTISNQSVADCVCRSVGRFHFPVPPEGGAATVNYSFIFTPAE